MCYTVYFQTKLHLAMGFFFFCPLAVAWNWPSAQHFPPDRSVNDYIERRQWQRIPMIDCVG